jgi:hypothetical protein
MPAAKFDFTDDFVIEQGVDFSRMFVWEISGEPVSLVGYTAKMHIRKNVLSADVLLELSTENGGISLGGTAGTVTLIFTKTSTAGATWVNGVYDLELTNSGGSTIRFMEGVVELSKEVTRG